MKLARFGIGSSVESEAVCIKAGDALFFRYV
jgi:hypothetical protein